MSWADLPVNDNHIAIISVSWSGDGKNLSLRGKESFVICEIAFDQLLLRNNTKQELATEAVGAAAAPLMDNTHQLDSVDTADEEKEKFYC